MTSSGKEIENKIEDYSRNQYSFYWNSCQSRSYDFKNLTPALAENSFTAPLIAKRKTQAGESKKKADSSLVSLPPLSVNYSINNSKVKNVFYDYGSKQLEAVYLGDPHASSVRIRSSVTLIGPTNTTPESVVIILPDTNITPSQIISAWGLSTKANTQKILFVIPDMNQSIYESKINNSVPWWTDTGSEFAKLSGLSWVSEVIPALLEKDYFASGFYQDVFIVGIGVGGAGAIKAASKLPFVKGVISISGTFYITGIPTGTPPLSATAIEYNKYKAILGERPANSARWIEEDLIQTPATTFKNPIDLISHSDAFYKKESQYLKEQFYSSDSSVTVKVFSSTSHAYWKHSEVSSYVFGKIDTWSSKRGTSKAQSTKQSFISKLNQELRVLAREEVTFTHVALKNRGLLFEGHDTSKRINPETPELEKCIQGLLKEKVAVEYAAYLASLGLLTDQTKIEGNYKEIQTKLLELKLKNDARREEIMKMSERLKYYNGLPSTPENDARKADLKKRINDAKYAQNKDNKKARDLEAELKAKGLQDLYPDYVAKNGRDGKTLQSDIDRAKAVQKYAQESANREKELKSLEPTYAPALAPETTASIATKTTTNLIKKFDTTQKEAVTATPAVNNTSNSTLFASKDPLAAQITTSTQLLKGDFMDARRYEAIMPVFYQSEVPAYITLKPDIGAPGAYSNEELGLAAGGDSTKTNQPAELSDPFKNGLRYNQFTLTSISETHGEKYQVIDTLANGQVLFSFGKKPEIWALQGLLINDVYSNWLGKFREVWNNHLRISKLVEHGKYARFVIPSQRIAFNGYPLALTLNHQSATEQVVPFSMLVFIREVRNFEAFPFDNKSAMYAMVQSLLFADGVKFGS